jgi:uncharacterized membrane protein
VSAAAFHIEVTDGIRDADLRIADVETVDDVAAIVSEVCRSGKSSGHRARRPVGRGRLRSLRRSIREGRAVRARIGSAEERAGARVRNDVRRPGLLALAFATIGTGVLALGVRDFGLFWRPVPAWIPQPTLATVALGALLVSAGIGLVFARSRKVCASCLALYELVWVVARSTHVLHRPAVVVNWESLCEALAQLLGFFLLAIESSRAAEPGQVRRGSDAALLGARAAFGACCVVFGVSHFAYAEFTAQMVPRGLPAPVVLAYLTGAAHAAAGIAILVRRLDRLAATLEAAMLGLFVVLVHLPSLWMTPPPSWAPTAPERWSELLIALSVAGAAGTVAESLRSRPWGLGSARQR